MIDPEDQTEATEGIRRLNEMASASPDLEAVLLLPQNFKAVLLPFADGMTVILRS